MDPKKIVSKTRTPPPPDPETLRREKEKRDREERQRVEEETRTGSRGPKSNLVKAAEAKAEKERFEAKCRKCGEAVCDSLVMAGYTVFGPEWAYLPPIEIPDGQGGKIISDEKKRMREAYGDMFVEYGWDVIPPWIPVLACTGSYVATRFQMESVKERFKKGFFHNLKERFKGFGKKTPPPPNDGKTIEVKP